MGNVLNLRDYGAKGDGVADDAPAIRHVLEMADAAGGATVIAPPGVYLLDSAPTWPAPCLLMPANTTLVAEDGAVFRRSVNLHNRLVQNFDGHEEHPGYSGRSNIHIVGGTWDGNAPDRVGGGNMMAFAHARNISVSEARFLDQPNNHAIEFNAIDGGQVRHCRFEGSVPKPDHPQTTEAIQIDGAFGAAGLEGGLPYDNTMSKDILVEGCTANASEKCGPWGLLVGSHAGHAGQRYEGIRVVNNLVLDSLVYGVRAYDWKNAEIVSNVIIGKDRDTYKAGICVASGVTSSDAVLVSNNVLDHAGGTGFGSIEIRQYTGAQNPPGGVIVSNNVISHYSGHGVMSEGDATQIIGNFIRASLGTAVNGIYVPNAGASHVNIHLNRVTGGRPIVAPSGTVHIGNDPEPTL